jgi:general secretion pathway protein J
MMSRFTGTLSQRNSEKIRISDRGFTLFEILIAIFIFSLVLVTVFGGFRLISASSGAVNQSNDIYEMVQGFMDLMTRDLESAYVEQKPAYVKPAFNGSPDSYRFVGKTEYLENTSLPVIRFTSNNHLPVNRDNKKGVSEIVYYADTHEEYGLILRRSDRINFSDEFVKKKYNPEVLRHLKTMTVTYYDDSNQDHDSWDSDTAEFHYATPSAVGVRIEIDDDGRTLEFQTRVTLRAVREKSD